MKTAGEIVQEYLDRGYGVESLRILAESREQPLAGEMLAVIDALEGGAAAREESGIAEALCETGSFARADGDALFFVADDEEAADAEGINFDLMAETAEAAEAECFAVREESAVFDVSVAFEEAPIDQAPADQIDIEEGPVAFEEPPAVLEESIADIVIGETSGADMVSFEAEAVAEISEIAEVAAESGHDAGAEISSDYIPGTAAMPLETTAAVPAEEEVGDPVAEQTEQPEQTAREKRRLARRERRKAARAKKAEEKAEAYALTLHSPETEEQEAQEAAETAEETARPPMGEVMGILTPMDLVASPEEEIGGAEQADAAAESAAGDAAPGIAPETLALLSKNAFAFVASLLATTQGELALASERIEQIRLASRTEEEEEDILASTAGAETPAEGENAGEESNIILFRDKFPLLAAESAAEEEEECGDAGDCGYDAEDAREALAFVASEEEEDAAEDGFTPVLRMLPPPEAETEEQAADREESLPPAVDFLAALEAVVEDAAGDIAEEEPECAPDAVLEEAPEDPVEARDAGPEAEEAPAEAFRDDAQVEHLASLLERETALRLQLEEEHQARLEEFAARLLEVQTVAATSETRASERKAELDARTAILEETRAKLAGEEEKQRALLQKLDEAQAALSANEDDLRQAGEIRSEHARLYGEFEDLRKSYNEIVTDVLPALQQERDDLALTVERQCEKERKLRSSLGSSRKRLAAGYILGAAACLMLVALPVANWLRSPDAERELALDRQRLSELQETLESQVMENVSAKTRIVELERNMTRARDEITRLDGQNRELASLADQRREQQHAQGIAVFAPKEGSGGGTPTRAMTMALQATAPRSGPLHVNEVRDPAGSIDQLALANRAKNPAPSREGEPRMAEGRTDAKGALKVSVIAGAEGGSPLRPKAVAVAQAASREAERSPATVTAKVKKGEGVAQVVYRVLNTRDPDVIAWVIQENKIRSDRRGNPLIQPNQELRLPRGGAIGQSASR